MKKIKAVQLNAADFAPFGQFYPMVKPEGLALCGALHAFYPDRLTGFCGKNVGFSPIVVKKPEKYIVDAVECHTTTWEMILPLSGDMLLHVSPKSGAEPETGLTRAFIVPQHTLVRMDAAVWHLCPLPVNAEALTAMIVLPECTYANDCRVVSLRDEQKFEIEL